MVTITDVAKKAGVGVSTVSKVLNNYEHVSDKTKAKVMAAVEELNYVPNSIASALSSKQSRRVGVVFFINNQRQAIDEINMQYLFGALNTAKELKLELVTVFSPNLENMTSHELERHFLSLRLNALVIYGLHKEEKSFLELIDQEKFPTVIVDAPIYGEKTSYVMVDHQKAQYDIVCEMIDQHENIESFLYLAGRRDGFVTDLRLQGAVDASVDRGVKINAQYANFSETEANQITLKYAEHESMVVAASDLMAIGSVNALKELDIFRPVCGFDGITLLGYIDYRILTVRQNFFDLSRHAIQEVDRLLSGEVGREVLMNYEIQTISYDDIIN